LPAARRAVEELLHTVELFLQRLQRRGIMSLAQTGGTLGITARPKLPRVVEGLDGQITPTMAKLLPGKSPGAATPTKFWKRRR
jgi:hypothetical protein